MKIYIITFATLVFILAVAFIQHNTRENVQKGPVIQQDALYACGWFPLCTDPDKKRPVLKPVIEYEPLLACGWFPLCTDPDQRKPAFQLENIAEIKPDTAFV